MEASGVRGRGRKHLDAIDIPGSEPGIYGPMLHADERLRAEI
jgi:hypothetical protein